MCSLVDRGPRTPGRSSRCSQRPSSPLAGLTGLYDTIAQPNDPSKEHTVRLLVRGWTYGDEAVFVYDAAEVPAGFGFNIDKITGYTEFPAG